MLNKQISSKELWLCWEGQIKKIKKEVAKDYCAQKLYRYYLFIYFKQISKRINPCTECKTPEDTRGENYTEYPQISVFYRSTI